MHVIKNNLALNCLEITVSGFWSPQHLDEFTEDLKRAIAAFPMTGRSPASLYNFTDAAIQPQSVVAKMQAMASSKTFRERKVALYTEGKLGRLQARRVSDASSNMRVFDTRAEAVAWLNDDVGPRQAPRPTQRSATGGVGTARNDGHISGPQSAAKRTGTEQPA